MKCFYLLIGGLFCISLLTGCKTSYPSSVDPGIFSTATGLTYSTNSFDPEYNSQGFSERDIIKQSSLKIIDTVRLPRQERKLLRAAQQEAIMQILNDSIAAAAPASAVPPGGVYIRQLQLFADEVEITNLHWQEFLYHIRRDSTIAYYESQLPDTAVVRLRESDYYRFKDTDGKAIDVLEPVSGYLYHPEYLFYPVVGVSYEQAVEYCKWRSRIVTNQYNATTENKQKANFTFRLPSEAEWEIIAAAGINKYTYPYSSINGGIRKYKVNPEAAEFLARKISSPNSVAQVFQDLKDTEVVDLVFNVKRPFPYFLQFNTPGYVYSGFANGYGVYNLIGNVAEMVAERGIAKGGSWKDELSASKITNKQTYTSPSDKIGFRCVCEIEALNQ